jgi:hypothetical protein
MIKVKVGVGGLVGRLPPGLCRCVWISGMVSDSGSVTSVGVQPKMKGIFVSIFVSWFWIILAFISYGQLTCYELLNVNDG